MRPKVATDGVLPSGNAIMILDLLELAARTGDDGYRQACDDRRCLPPVTRELSLAQQRR